MKQTYGSSPTDRATCRWRIVNLGHFLDFAILLRCSVMRDLAVLFIHLITTIARLAGPGGAHSVVAESVLVKQQFLILNRSRHRSPNLRVCDRVVAGLCALLMRPGPTDPFRNRIETVNSLEPSSSAEEPQVPATVLAVLPSSIVAMPPEASASHRQRPRRSIVRT